MSKDELDAISKSYLELSGQIHGLTIALSHLFAIEARECPGGAADRALGDVEGTVEAAERQLPDVLSEFREAIIVQLRRCLQMASHQVAVAKSRAPTSSRQN